MKLLKKCLLSYIITNMFIVSSAACLFAAEPIDIKKIGNGEFIGKYIEYLNEKELFESIKHNWKIEPVFINKILSGELHSDDTVKLNFENTSSGYEVTMQLRAKKDNERRVEWGIHDILREDVSSQFIQSNRSILMLNFIPHAYWLRFKVSNAGSKGADLYLELDKHFTVLFDIFIPAGNGFIKKHGNFIQTLAEREQHYKNLGFNIPVKPGINTYYLRLDTDWQLDNLPLRLWSKENFSSHIYIDNLIQGIILGVFILLFFYNIFIFFLTREKSFMYLSILIITQLALHVCYSGSGFQYLWPDDPLFGAEISFALFPLHLLFNVIFCRSFIETKKNTPGTDRLILGIIYIFIIIAAIMLFVPHNIKKIIFSAIILIDFIYYWPLIFSSIIVIKKGHRTGLFALIGLALYFLSQLEWILSNLDIIPYNLINYLQIKGVSYIILMTLGLGFKIRGMKKSLNDLNDNLERKIRERIDELQTGLKLKKTEKSITDTTKIKIETVKEYLSENYSCDISREGLAAAAEMSPDHLGRMFKQYTGERISDFVNRIRINEASRKLQESDENIIDIAFSVGYESLRTFNIVFAKIMKMSPSNYRKGSKNK